LEFSVQLVTVLSALGVVLAMPLALKPPSIPSTKEGALAAIQQIVEWAKWMSGIQTAAIAGLAAMVFTRGSIGVQPIPLCASVSALAAFVFLGAALFLNAWVLSAMPSHALRVHAKAAVAPPGSTEFDIYEQSLYGWSERVSLGYMLAAKHWLWGAGLLAFGSFFLALLARGAPCA
jgi:hypothetical protein